MGRLIWAFTVHICPEFSQGVALLAFSMMRAEMADCRCVVFQVAFDLLNSSERFCYHFAKGDNSCRQELAFLPLKTFEKCRLLLKERICSQRKQILSF